MSADPGESFEDEVIAETKGRLAKMEDRSLQGFFEVCDQFCKAERLQNTARSAKPTRNAARAILLASGGTANAWNAIPAEQSHAMVVLQP